MTAVPARDVAVYSPHAGELWRPRAELAARARSYVATTHSAETVTDAWARLIEELA